MLYFRSSLLTATTLILAMGCSSPASDLPTVESLSPSTMATGETPYLTITGSGFAPFLVNSLDDGETDVELDFELILDPADGSEEVSIEADYLDSEHIGAQIPSGLAAGSYSVWVRGPKGAGPMLPDALVVGGGGGGGVDAGVDAGSAVCDATTCADGTCVNGACVIECQGQCSEVVCPAGIPCVVNCQLSGSCASLVDCSAASSCDITCMGQNACAGGVLCGSGDCDIACFGMNSCSGTLDCGSSCACDTSCSPSSVCGNPTTCPLDQSCTSNSTCTSAGAGCDTCQS